MLKAVGAERRPVYSDGSEQDDSAMLELRSAVLDVRPMLRGSEKAVVESVLGRQPGVERVEANPVAQTATVSYDPAQTSVEQLRRAVEECGYHCRGQSVPTHLCDPAAEPSDSRDAPTAATPAAPEVSPAHHGHHESHAAPAVPEMAAADGDHGGHADHAALRSPQEVM
ncbi:MAG: heavy metal-associated domain-containing protein, partial [Candidatus Limnocylindrales bacterium]